ncbi:MAG: hypothetical protein IT423_14385, partial [Pirellulaceae bacterium]|nr:hypothetical protein [Pirellulaceae bacterium]
MSTTSSDENCAPTELKPIERAPTRASEIVRLEIAQLSIESGVTFGHIVQRACASTAQTLGVSRVGAWVLVNDRTALKCFKLLEATTGSWSAGAML